MMPHSCTPSVRQARELVLRYGYHSSVYQILNKGISHWHAPHAPAVVGYVRRHRLVIAAGAPVCPEASLGHVTSTFEQWARAGGRGVCYFAAESRLRRLLAGSKEHAAIAIGAQPVWDPRTWDATVAGRPSLRQQIRRARNKGVIVTPWSPPAARDDPGVRACLDEWLASKPLPPMHFLVEPETLDGVIEDRLAFVATREQPGGGPRIVAFLIASPVPGRNGYLIEQIARQPKAPNGTAELLIDAAMRDFARRQCAYATLGLVALAEHARHDLAGNPLWLRALMAWARAHGRRFYNFAGLEAFRAKMNPDRWEPVFAIANEPRFSPATLHAVAAAFCNGSPEIAIVRALGKALRKEITVGGKRIRAALSPGGRRVRA